MGCIGVAVAVGKLQSKELVAAGLWSPWEMFRGLLGSNINMIGSSEALLMQPLQAPA